MATRKKRRKKKASKALPDINLGSKRAIKVVVDHKKDPVYKLKPGDIIWYTDVDNDGTKGSKELHIVLEHTYEMDPDRLSSHPTLRLVSGKLQADVLYCFGSNACMIDNLTETHKIEMSIVNNKSSFKLAKKRKSQAAK